jgi:hypothetical protein
MKTSIWIPYFTQEIEKNANPIGAIIGTGLTVAMGVDTAKDISSSKSRGQLQSLQANEPSMKLPDPSGFQFGGSKRINSSTITAAPKF